MIFGLAKIKKIGISGDDALPPARKPTTAKGQNAAHLGTLTAIQTELHLKSYIYTQNTA